MTKATKKTQTDSFDQAISLDDEAIHLSLETSSTQSSPASEPIILTPVEDFFNRISNKSIDTQKLIEDLAATPEWATFVDEHGFNALTLALLAKRNALALELIRLKSDVNACSTEMGWNPLTIASGSFEGQDQVAYQLLASGANPNSKTHLGLYALTSCCTYGNLKLAQELINKGAVASPEDAAWPPIIAAAGSENLELVDLLIDSGADVNSSLGFKNGFSPLHQAVKSENSAMVQHLIDLDANPSVMNIEGNTPLHYAAERDLVDIIKVLVASGANLGAENVAGKIPSELSVKPDTLNALSFDGERVRHPLSGKKKKTATIDDVIEPGIKKNKKTSLEPKPTIKKVVKSKSVKSVGLKQEPLDAKPVKVVAKPKKSTVKKKNVAKKAPTTKNVKNKLLK